RTSSPPTRPRSAPTASAAGSAGTGPDPREIASVGNGRRDQLTHVRRAVGPGAAVGEDRSGVDPVDVPRRLPGGGGAEVGGEGVALDLAGPAPVAVLGRHPR